MRRLMRALGVAGAIALAFAVVFPVLYSAIVPEIAGAAMALPMPPDGQYAVHVADWDYHTSIALPQPAAWALGPPGQEHAPWVEYAWGDRGFYRDADYRPHSVLATLFLPTSSVTYIAGRDTPPTVAGGADAVYVRHVDALTLHALAVELEGTVRRDARGVRVSPSARVPGFDGRFHDAHGSYLWTRNCNWWTVERLAVAGLATHGRFVIVSGQVAGRLRGFHRPVR